MRYAIVGVLSVGWVYVWALCIAAARGDDE
jgi:hypothetical protein